MGNIILTTPEELKAIVESAVSVFIKNSEPKQNQPDTITLTKALELLAEHGYPTSRAKVYKLTSTGMMPHRKYGNKLVFSRTEILDWATKECVRVGDHTDAVLSIARSARRKSHK